MYKINLNFNENKEPWLLPLESRCSMFYEALAKGKKVAMLLYEGPDTSTFRYRGYNILRATQGSEEWSSIYFFMNEKDTIIEMLHLAHLFVIIRVKWTHDIDQIVYRLRERKVKVLFDVDDLIFDIDYLNLVTNTLNVEFGSERDYEFWFAYIGRIGFTASKADGFITTNSFLGEKLKSKYDKPYGIIANSLNQEQLIASEKILEVKRTQQSRRPFTLGYFSGTPSHINDFKIISEELIALLTEFPDMNLNVVGFMEFPLNMKSFLDRKRITFTPLVDFIELQRLIAEVDINIVPLVNNTFTNCKSELKFFEAAIVDTLTIATPTYTYDKSITDGVNGFLCKPGQWYDRIKEIYLGKIDTDAIINNAHIDAIRNYSGDTITKMIEECYSQFFS